MTSNSPAPYQIATFQGWDLPRVEQEVNSFLRDHAGHVVHVSPASPYTCHSHSAIVTGFTVTVVYREVQG